MKPPPTTTARSAEPAASRIRRESSTVRRLKTPSRSTPGTRNRLGAAPVAIRSFPKWIEPPAVVTRRAPGSTEVTEVSSSSSTSCSA
jgi:hypothetical protein